MTKASIPMQIHDAQKLEAQFREHVPQQARVGERQPKAGVKAFCDEYLMGRIDAPDVLSPVMRMNEMFRGPILEHLNNDGPWTHTGPRLEVTLRNRSSSTTVPVMTGYEDHEMVDETGMSADRYHREVFTRMLAPGETITLNAERAIQALHRYCKTAMQPVGQQAWPHDHDVLVEDGWRGVVKGKPVESAAKAASKSRK